MCHGWSCVNCFSLSLDVHHLSIRSINWLFLIRSLCKCADQVLLEFLLCKNSEVELYLIYLCSIPVYGSVGAIDNCLCPQTPASLWWLRLIVKVYLGCLKSAHLWLATPFPHKGYCLGFYTFSIVKHYVVIHVQIWNNWAWQSSIYCYCFKSAIVFSNSCKLLHGAFLNEKQFMHFNISSCFSSLSWSHFSCYSCY